LGGGSRRSSNSKPAWTIYIVRPYLKKRKEREKKKEEEEEGRKEGKKERRRNVGTELYESIIPFL
jgi:hypothetical protein